MSWQGIQQYQQLIPHLEEGHVRAAMDLEFHLEASKAKQVGKINFYSVQRSIFFFFLLRREGLAYPSFLTFVNPIPNEVGFLPPPPHPLLSLSKNYASWPCFTYTKTPSPPRRIRVSLHPLPSPTPISVLELRSLVLLYLYEM